MNAVEFGKDITGEENLFNDEYYRSKEDNIIIGQKPEDFEILKFLGKGGFGKVYKVKYKLNNQIYAMKIFDKNIDKIKSNLSIKFNHPNIIKIYHHFEANNKLYVIMEYISNGNLKDFIIANNENIFEKEQIFSFLLQSIWALYYIHNGKKMILRNIKPENILIDDNMKIKFGEFLSTEIPDNSKEKEHPYKNKEDIKEIWEETNKYISKKFEGKKNDVYSLGLILTELIGSDNNEYSKVINSILKDMRNQVNIKLENDVTFDIFERISQFYSEKQNNSSIDAIVLCLKSFENTSNLLISNFEKADKNSEFKKNEVIDKYYQLIKLIYNKGGNFIYWNRNINELRLALMNEIISLEGIDAIEPDYAYLYLINLFIGLSVKDYLKNNPSNTCLVPHITNFKKEEEYLNNSNRLNYINDNFELLNNSIGKDFLGLIRIKSTCHTCELTKFEFKNFLMIDFNPAEIINDEKNKKENLEKMIKIDQMVKKFKENEIDSQCEQCLKITEHKSIKEIYSLPDSLVINIKDNIYNDKNCIDIKEEIELNDLDKYQNNAKKYELVGILKLIKKKENNLFYSFSKFNNKWFLSQRYKGIDNVIMTETHLRSKNVRMLFYQVKK